MPIPGSIAGGEVDLRLIAQDQLAALQRMAKIGFHERAALDALLDLVAAEPTEIAALGLGAVHGAIGLAQQRGAVAAVLRVEGDAEARGDRDAVRVDRHRRHHRIEQLARHQPGMLGLGQVLDHQRELVTAEPRHRVGLAQTAAQAHAHDRQQPVAGDVAQAIVDRLEAVQVEHHDGGDALVAARPGQRALETIVEQRAIGEAGQLVVLRQAAEALRLSPPAQGIADRALEQGGVDAALVEVVGGAELHRLRGPRSSAAALGQHDDRRIAAAARRGAHDLEAVAVRQGLLQQADVERRRAEPRQPALQIACPVDREAGMRRGIEQVARMPVVGLVVLDQQHPDRIIEPGSRLACMVTASVAVIVPTSGPLGFGGGAHRV